MESQGEPTMEEILERLRNAIRPESGLSSEALAELQVLAKRIAHETGPWSHHERVLYDVLHDSDLVDLVQTYLEGWIALQMDVTTLRSLAEQQALIDPDARQPVDCTDPAKGLGPVCGELMESLVWKVWRWTIWWANPLQGAAPAYYDLWPAVQPQLAAIAEIGKRYREDLRWRFLASELAGFQALLEQLRNPQ